MPKPDTYNEGIESFTNYKERLDAHFVANDIPVAKQTATLLSSIGAKCYNTLRSLTAPDLPSTKTYNELCQLLTTHFCPPPLEIVERFKFHKRNQASSESISEYIAAIKRLSEHCNFGDVLKMTLRDRFVCGIRDETIQKRLLQENHLTFDKATTLALAMETAHRDAAEIHGSDSAVLHKISKSFPKHSRTQQMKPFPPCQSCGKTNHKRSDCFWRDATCKKCSKRGHIQAICHSPNNNNNNNNHYQSRKNFNSRPKTTTRLHSQKVHELDEDVDEDHFTLEMFQIKGSTSKLMTSIQIDSVNVSMEIDTGSAVSVMTAADYKKIFEKTPMLQPTDIRLKTYTGEIIYPLGKLMVNVEKNGQAKTLPLLILNKGSNPIFGRDWLQQIKLDWKNINSLQSTPTDNHHQFINAIKTKFADVFSDGIGAVQGQFGSLRLKPDATPKFCKARPVPYALKSKVEKELDNLEKQGIISKVTSSDWATPIVPVVKGNGDVRICGDFKITVNPALEVEQYTLPRMEDMLATLEQGKTFSKIDLRQAYLQLMLDETSKQITTINTSKGLYSYNRLPFGITSSPAIWQKTMDIILQGIAGIQCNQDDMIITGPSREDHEKNLLTVLERLQKHGLKANLDKCEFFQKEVTFCGIKISEKGLHKTDGKINAVKNAPRPDNKSQLRSFLGLVNYYHKWLDNIATIAKPLYDLLQNTQPFQWSTKCEAAFNKIKEMVASDKVLIRFDPTLPLRLATDASPYGIGAVLSHITKDNEERPIAYASRTLNSAERNYSQLDKEALSIVWAVKKFFNYLCGKHFTLITDHQPLKYIFSPTRGIPAMSAARQQRYALFLSGFNYTIEYRNSKANANADGLSRLPLPTTVNNEAFEKGNDLFYSDILESIPVDTNTVAKSSRTDKIISKVIQMVNKGEWPSSPENDIEKFKNKRHELSVQQNCLFWGYRLIPPQNLHKKILDTLHVGHLGVVKMKNMARQYFWWPGMDKEIECITKQCNGCAYTQPDPAKAPLHPWNWPEKPWQRIHVDYAGPFLNTMFLVVVDAHSKWAEIIPTSTATSTSTINILSSLFARFGLPENLVSDNGPQFTSTEFKLFMKHNSIRHIFTAPYHPATNGLAERMVQTFKQTMKASKNDSGNIHIKLNRFLLAYRNAPHSTTNETPAFLMFGRQIRNHLDIIIPNTKSTVHAHQHKQTDSHSRANIRDFNPGDNVLVRDYRGHQRWQHGTISQRNGSRSFDVEISPGTTWKRHSDQIVHTHASPEVSKPALPSPVPLAYSPLRNPKPTTSGRANNSTRPQVEHATCSPNMDESPSSPSLFDSQSQSVQSDKRTTYTTRSGRAVRKPNRYSE